MEEGSKEGLGPQRAVESMKNRVSSDRENRELSGKLAILEISGNYQGISLKTEKIRDFFYKRDIFRDVILIQISAFWGNFSEKIGVFQFFHCI